MRYIGTIGVVAVIGGILVLASKLGAQLNQERDRKRNSWHQVKAGRFAGTSFDVRHVERAENEYGIGRNHEYRVRYRTAKEDITVVRFEDGATCVLDGQVEVLFSVGAEIRVEENLLGERRVVLA